MKTSFWDKVLMFLYVLIALAFSVCMALRGFGVDLLGAMFAGLEQGRGASSPWSSAWGWRPSSCF